MTVKLDRDKPHSFVRGLPGIFFEQDGLPFDFHGNLVVQQQAEEPVPEPAPVVERKLKEIVMTPKAPWKTAAVEPEVESQEDFKPWFPELDLKVEPAEVAEYSCLKCDFVGKSEQGLKVHKRVKGH